MRETAIRSLCAAVIVRKSRHIDSISLCTGLTIISEEEDDGT